MKVLVIGNNQHAAECEQKFGHDHTYLLGASHSEAAAMLLQADVVFDFILADAPNGAAVYTLFSNVVFINTAKETLAKLTRNLTTKATFIGFNGLPTFLNRPWLEVCVRNTGDQEVLTDVCKNLKTDFTVVDDRVGLVTPRIVCMIINEAYYTVQEGTATREDIDLAMRLGTNYPFGPFEWCLRIGVQHVYDLLEAVYNDTHDERYKICALLKKEYVNS